MQPVRIRPFAWVLLAGALFGCRQTVFLDPYARDGSIGSYDSGVQDEGATVPDTVLVTDGPGRLRFDGGHGGRTGPEDAPVGICVGGQLRRLSFSLRSPEVILSVDRSSAQQVQFGASTRLRSIQSQLRQIVSQYQEVVRFGYQEFPGTMSMCMFGQGCCAGDVTLPTFNNFPAIDSASHACDNIGAGCIQPERPVAAALASCGSAFASLNDNDRNHYVLLLSDGDPTCASLDPQGSACDDAVTEAAKLKNAMINTIVVDVGDNVTPSTCLGMIALSDGPAGSISLPSFRLAGNEVELANVLANIVRAMAAEACHIDVLSPPSDPSQVSLLFDGAEVPMDPINGWDFDNSSLQITVRGKWCDTLLTQQLSQIEVVSGCPH
jgi:hypothetical protein